MLRRPVRSASTSAMLPVAFIARASSVQSVVVPEPPFEPMKSETGESPADHFHWSGPGVAISSPTMIWTALEGARAGAGAGAPIGRTDDRGRRPDRRRRTGRRVADQRQLFDRLGANRFARRTQRQPEIRVSVGPGEHIGLLGVHLERYRRRGHLFGRGRGRGILEIGPHGEYADAAQDRDGLRRRAPAVGRGGYRDDVHAVARQDHAGDAFNAIDRNADGAHPGA